MKPLFKLIYLTKRKKIICWHTNKGVIENIMLTVLCCCVCWFAVLQLSVICFLGEKNFFFFFPPIRAHLVPLSGHVNHAAAQHVLHGSTAREGSVRDVLPGSCALPQLFLALSHRLLPFWEGVSHLLQVSPHRRACACWLARSLAWPRRAAFSLCCR